MRIMGFGMEKNFVFAGFKGEQSGHCDDKFWVENNSVNVSLYLSHYTASASPLLFSPPSLTAAPPAVPPPLLLTVADNWSTDCKLSLSLCAIRILTQNLAAFLSIALPSLLASVMTIAADTSGSPTRLQKKAPYVELAIGLMVCPGQLDIVMNSYGPLIVMKLKDYCETELSFQAGLAASGALTPALRLMTKATFERTDNGLCKGANERLRFLVRVRVSEGMELNGREIED
ncbi:hypothetical protein TEA_028743 [Camellia sinensis var. sinensis]|uniref:Uncharacterized protein n=1 Tax=Camellia sinensis var. sinensis TaxID=542762 RepID=A0A4S4D230_CAMSN|nr:hypothetical protein TEA_028743 [Camellia sinensis var. sinensis]